MDSSPWIGPPSRLNTPTAVNMVMVIGEKYHRDVGLEPEGHRFALRAAAGLRALRVVTDAARRPARGADSGGWRTELARFAGTTPRPGRSESTIRPLSRGAPSKGSCLS